MVAAQRAELGVTGFELRPMLHQLQGEAVLLTVPGLYIAGLLVLVSAGEFPDLARGVLTGLGLYLLGIVVFLLRRRSHLAAAWALVAGCLLSILQVAAWGRLEVALFLLMIPTGLAALTIGIAAGVLVALASTSLLLFPPHVLPTPQPALRATALIGVWSTVAMIWLTLRPLLTALEWSWSSYLQSRSLLEQARDYQVQLKQTLADLADANLQLTRLDRLAQGMRQAAEEARRAAEQFVANVSHELRTPLNMIIGFSEMILEAPAAYGSELPPGLLADLDIILRNSQHLSSLIDDVLDLSQIEAGQVALSKERVRLAEIIEAAMVAVRPLFASKGLEMQAEVPADLEATCDRTRIREVVLNLLSNAGRFTERGGACIRAWRDGDQALVSVTDTGPGIAADDVGKIFRPFQQVDGSLRRRYGGTGLGLAISRSFVELHGGKMWFESEVGVGTTFYFRLPVEPPGSIAQGPARWLSAEWQYAERTHRSLVPAAMMRPRYVVLESGKSLQRLLGRYLDGAEVVPVNSQEEAARELERVPSRALLVNETAVGEALGRLSGSEVLPYRTPAIVCSVPGASEAASALGASGYLVKPIAHDDLLDALDRLSLAGKTVLIVDDEPDALRLFWRMLAASGRGYRVLTASGGREAMAILRDEHPDAILLDLVMPEMDGFQLLAALREDPALRGIPVVLISARDPAGQPIVTSALAITCRGGLSAQQLLACVDGLTEILATGGPTADPERPAAPPG